MDNKIIRVKGKGQIKAKPDMTRVTLTLKGIKKKYDQALVASSDDTEAAKDLLEQEGFNRSDVKTVSFDVGEKYERLNIVETA